MEISSVNAFLEESRNLLGADHIVEGGDKLAKVSRDPVYTCRAPVASVYPGNTSEVSQIVQLASQYGVSIWVYSTAQNWGYCNTAGAEGCVLMILSRMNRILEVDEELAFVEIEPGVTYAQLNRYLRENKIPLWSDCTGGPPTGSVLGNATDRGFGVTPYSDHYEQLCGLEVVLADGTVVRTGGFGGEKTNRGAWHTFQRAAGPILDGLFSQSNLGVVVRAGIWLMPEPEHLEVGSLRIEKEDDLPAAIDTMRDLMLRGDLPGRGRFTNDIGVLTLLTQVRKEGLADREGCLSAEEIRRMRGKHGIAPWNGAYGLYGSRAMVKAAKKQTGKRLKKFGRLTFLHDRKIQRIERILEFVKRKPGAARLAETLVRRFFGCSLEMTALVPRLMELHRGIPNESIVRRAYFYHSEPSPEADVNVPRDGIGLIWFVPLVPFRGREIVAYLEECKEIYTRHGFDHTVSITPINVRTVVPLMVILHQRNDPASCDRAGALFEELQVHALERGYQQFRCGHPGWERLFDLNPELKKLNERIKQALDPKGVLAPGRYGIGLGEKIL